MISDLNAAQPQPQSPRPVSWKVVLALSLLPGGGHVYLGYTLRGFLHLALVGALVTLLSANVLGRIEPFFTLIFLFVLLHNFLDAYRLGALRNQGEGPPFERPLQVGRTAQVWLGLLSMSAGTVLLLVLRFGVDLRWLLEWWPLTFIALGAWLLVQARRR